MSTKIWRAQSKKIYPFHQRKCTYPSRIHVKNGSEPKTLKKTQAMFLLDTSSVQMTKCTSKKYMKCDDNNTFVRRRNNALGNLSAKRHSSVKWRTAHLHIPYHISHWHLHTTRAFYNVSGRIRGIYMLELCWIFVGGVFFSGKQGVCKMCPTFFFT